MPAGSRESVGGLVVLRADVQVRLHAPPRATPPAHVEENDAI